MTSARLTTSAVIPCHNAGPFLAEALASVRSQTRPLDEIIVVDDCSTDNSAEIARGFDVIYLRTPRNLGPAAARNLGAQQARGDLLAWLDADDYWEPEHCEVVVGLLERYPEAAVAASAVRRFGSRTGVFCPHFDVPQERPFDAFWPAFRRTIVPQMSAITRTSAFLAVGGYDPGTGLAEDYDLWLRLARRFPFVCTRAVTCNYRWHDAQLSRNQNVQERDLYRCRVNLWRRVSAEGNSELARQIGERIWKEWHETVRGAWDSRDLKRFRFYQSLVGSVPTAPFPVRARWAVRTLMPDPAIRAIDRALGRLA